MFRTLCHELGPERLAAFGVKIALIKAVRRMKLPGLEGIKEAKDFVEGWASGDPSY